MDESLLLGLYTADVRRQNQISQWDWALWILETPGLVSPSPWGC